MNIDDDDEVPASPHTTKRRRSRNTLRNSKRNKLSLKKSDGKTSDVTGESKAELINKYNNIIPNDISKQDAVSPLNRSESMVPARVEDDVMQAFSVYDTGEEVSDYEDSETLSSRAYDILLSAKLIERANSRPLLGLKKRTDAFLRICPRLGEGPVPLSQILRCEGNESNLKSAHSFQINKICGQSSFEEPLGTYSVPEPIKLPNQKTILKFVTESFPETDTQIVKACNLTDAAQLLLTDNVQFSEWISPLRRQTSQPKTEQHVNIVESILNDFGVDTSMDSPTSMTIDTNIEKLTHKENIGSRSPPLILKRDSLRTYSHLSAKKKQAPRKLQFDHFDSASSSDSEMDGNIDYDMALLNRTVLEIDELDDLDINNSHHIIENFANLSSYFSQTSFPVGVAGDDQLLSKKCDPGSITIVPDPDISTDESFGYLNACDIPIEKIHIQSPVESTDHPENDPANLVKAELPIICDKSLLDEDDEILMNISSQVIDHTKIKPALISTPVSGSSFVNTTDINDDDTELLLPKRLRFDSPVRPQTVKNQGLTTARQNFIPVSHRALKKSSNMFADLEIEHETEVVASVPSNTLTATYREPSTSSAMVSAPFAGFQTGNGRSIQVAKKNLDKYSKLYEEVAETLAKNPEGVSDEPLHLDVTKSTKSLQLGGFSTARGNAINISEKSLQKSAALFDEINETEHLSEDSVHSLIHPSLNTVPINENENTIAVGGGFTTARGSSISISSKAVKNTAGIFDNIDQEEDRDTSVSYFKSAKSHPLSDVLQRPETFDFEGGSFKGFSTAKGDKIAISKRALLATEKLFEMEGEDNLFVNNASALVKSNRTEVTKTPVNVNSNSVKHRSINAIAGPSSSNHDIFKTPKNSRSLGGFSTSTPNTFPPEPNMAKTLDAFERYKADSLGFLREIEGDVFQELFPDDEDFGSDPKTSARLTDQKFPKRTCLASRFNDMTADELDGESICSEESAKKQRDTCPEPISENVKLDRRAALKEQRRIYKARSERVRPCPGALFVSKLASDRSSLSNFRPPLNLQESELKSIGITESTLAITISNIKNFCFKMWEHYPLDVCLKNTEGILMKDQIVLIMNEESTVGTYEISNAFLCCPSVDPKLVPDNWIANSLKWIIWKLASMELRFPYDFATNGLTPENVLLQLKYRYDCEIDRTQRSAIRKIVERDDVAGKRMVLFVSNIFRGSTEGECSIELSDGWYAIRTCIDAVLINAVIASRKIQIGTKLIIQGAELIGSEEGCSPLEMPGSVQLKISANSTRRAKWHLRLGYYQYPYPFILSLESIKPCGGLISRLAVYVLRIYPVMYMVKTENGGESKTVFRSEKVERRCNSIEGQKRLEIIEKFHFEVSKEVDDEYEARKKTIKSPKRKLTEIDDAEELWEFMEHSHDPVAVEMDLSSTQKQMARDFYEKLYERKMDEISRRVTEKLHTLSNQPKITSLLKFRVIDARHPTAKTAIISIWNPSEFHESNIREGKFIEISNASASGLQRSDVQISAGRNTIFKEVFSTVQDQHRQMERKLTLISEIDPKMFSPYFNEFDTVGYVVAIEECNEKKFQPVYIADAAKNLMCINFWLGIKEYAYDDVVICGRFLAISQLQWRSWDNAQNRSGFLLAFASEFTVFTENPRATHLKSGLEQLQHDIESISDLNVFRDGCKEVIGAFKAKSTASKDITPLRTISINNFANISPMVTPLSNRTSLGLRAPKDFSQSVPSSIVRNKMDILGNVPAPPPISPLFLRRGSTKQSLKRAFKSPLTNPSLSSK